MSRGVMQASPFTLHRSLDELALDAMIAHPLVPVARASERDLSIEVLFEDDDAEDLAATSQFVRFSEPYERVEIEARPVSPVSPGQIAPTRARLVQTVPARVDQPIATVPFETVWFDHEEDALTEIEDVPATPPRSWWWLVLWLTAAGAAVALTSAVIYTRA